MANLDIVVRKPRAINVPNIVGIECGSDHSALIDDSGRLLTFGSNQCGQLGVGTYSDEFVPAYVRELPTRIIQVACGVDHTLILV